MSIANKFNIPPALLETIKKMNAEGTEYQEKVKALLKKRGFTSIGQMSPEEKKDFFNTLDAMHKAKNEEVDLDEAFPKSTGHALVHSSSGKIVAKGNKEEMMKKMKELNAKEKGSHHLGRTSSGKVGDTFGLGSSPADKLSIRKEEVELQEKFSPAQIDKMRQEYDKIKGIDPASDNYKKLTAMLDKLDIKTLQSLAGAKIKFVSGLAQNRVVRKMNEEVELDEILVVKTNKPIGTRVADIGPGGKEYNVKTNKAYDDAKKKKPQGAFFATQRRKERLASSGRMDEEDTIQEGKSSTGYELYHKDFSLAMAHAYDFAKKKYNIEIDPLEIDRNVAMGPRKPGSGKANAYRLLDKTGKKAIQVQVANLDNKRYELNMYKEEVELEEDLSSSQRDTHFSLMNKHGVLAKSAKGAEKDKHRMAALDHQMALRNPENSQSRSKALSLSNKLGVKEEVELDETNNARSATKSEYQKSLKTLEKMPEFGAMSKSLKRRDQDAEYDKRKQDEFKKSLKKEEVEMKDYLVKFEKQGKVSVKNYSGKSDLDVHSKAKVDAKRMGMTVASVRLKEEVEEAVNPQKSMKRAGLSVERAKEVMRHQKEIGTIRKKRESLRNSFDPVNTVLEAYKKNKMKKEATAKDKNKSVQSGDKLSGKTEPIEIDPELKEQKS